MDLQKNSLEYAHIVFSVAPPQDAVVEASVDLLNWTPLSFDTDGTGKVLLRGPLSAASVGLLVKGTSQLYIRVTEDPEIIVRSAGMVSIY